MKLRTKILILTISFAVQSTLYLINAILVLSEGGSYGKYGNSFVYAGIFGYIAYLLYTTRNKRAYWMAVVFTGFAVIRFLFGGALMAWSGIAPSVSQIVLIVFFVGLFGVIPLIFLVNKELRAAYFSQK